MTIDSLKIVFSTLPEIAQAELLAKQLVERKLAACVNIIPNISSFYHWDEKIEQSNEVLLMIKTKEKLIVGIEDFFTKNHPYDIPELISCNIDGGSASYMEWLTASLK